MKNAVVIRFFKCFSTRSVGLMGALLAQILFININATAINPTIKNDGVFEKSQMAKERNNVLSDENRQNKEVTQQNVKIEGIVTDPYGEPLIGVTIVVDGTKLATLTDADGKFSLTAPTNGTLKVSYIGFETQIIPIDKKTYFNIVLGENTKLLDEVVIVGYGQQKKESVVGAISQTKGDDLMRTGISSSIGQAMSGLLPGLSTTVVSGMPGAEDPKISIRGLSSWNGSDPLVLVDGVERSMSDLDIGQIESISILKDASATAVFGVKGAEGVILITTKRGKEGKAQISFSANTSFKYIGELPDRLSSYDTYSYQNEMLEKQNAANQSSWGWYMPQGELEKFRNPSSLEESYLYPNVDWANEITKDYAMTQRYDLNISGGTAFAKYFAALSYLKDDDLLQSGQDVGLPYKPQWGFEHYNLRSNIDLNLTKTTVFSTNLAGSFRKKDSFTWETSKIWDAFYRLSPSTFPVQYEDGTFGYNANKPSDINPVSVLSGNSALSTNYTSQLFSDFTLKQDLGFVTPGLSAQATLSYDNRLYSSKTVSQITLLSKSISRDGIITYNPANGGNDYDYYSLPGTISAENFSVEQTERRLYYKGQLNYARSFGKHDVSALALMSREEQTSGSEFPHYREDWVGRLTYAFDSRYFLEANGAYNGSEKFAAKYRFGFFPSIGLGWMASNESFLKDQKWLDKLKVRYSRGSVGSDNFASQRWSYQRGWGIVGSNIKAVFGQNYAATNVSSGAGATYLEYEETVVANPNLQWEVSTKQNLGIEVAAFKNIFTGSFELFKDDRKNVFMSATQRANSVPAYFGAAPVAANLGRVQNKGFELDLKLQYTFSKVNTWIRYTFAHAKDKIIFMDDPELMPFYKKNAGYQIGQTRSQLEQPGYTTSWDDVYGSVGYESNSGRLPGEVVMVDYNSDGVINNDDYVPYGYPNRPQNTYNIFLGVDYKGFSAQIHFLGVNNVSQYFSSVIATFDERAPFVYSSLTDYWTTSNPNAAYPIFRAKMPQTRGKLLDGSYLRLKDVELSYTFQNDYLRKMRISALKVIVSGNNLLFWSDMPEDREEAIDILSTTSSRYPTVKRINLGLNITF